MATAIFAFDWDTATRWTTGVSQAAGQFFQINSNSCAYVNRIVMDSGTSTNDFARSFQVLTSIDGTNWTTAVASGTGSAAVVDVSFTGQPANYLKVVLTGSDAAWWSLHDVHIYASDLCHEAPRKDLNTNISWTATGYKANGTATTTYPGSNSIDDNATTGTINCPLTADTYMDQQQATTNLGTASLVDAGASRYSTLLKFDPDACMGSGGKVITSATLKVKIYDTSVGAFSLATMKRNWSETTSTWNLADTNNAWQTPGALGANDVTTTIIGTIPANTATTQFAWVSIPLDVNIVKDWDSSPVNNAGIEIRRSDTSNDAMIFYSREAATANQPYIQVTYTDVGGWANCNLLADGYLDSGQPTSNLGTVSLVNAGGSRYSTLLKMDTSCMTPGSVVDSASLYMMPYDYSLGAFKIMPMLRSWSETTSTWNVASTGTNWQVAGASGATDVSTTIIGSIPANTATSTFGGGQIGAALSPSAVTGWLNTPATNYGMKMMRADTGSDYLLWYARESVLQNRPYIQTSYHPGPNVTTKFATEEAQAPGQRLEVNFGICHAVDRVVMTSGSAPTEYPRGYEIYFSMDGVNWGSPVKSGTPTAYPVDTGLITQTRGRYMKIVQTGSATAWWSVDNLQVFAHPCYDLPSNYTHFVRTVDGAWIERRQNQFNGASCRGLYDEPCSGASCYFGPNGFSQAFITSNAPVDFPPPWGQWKMDEVAGLTAADSALTFSSSDNLVLTNGAIFTPSGHVSAALSLDGIDDYAVSASPSQYLKVIYDRFSMSAWVKLTTTDTNGGEVLSMADNYGLRVNPDGNVSAWVTDGSGTKKMATSTGVNVKDGVWHNLIGNYKTTAVEVYVDGVVKGSTPASGNMSFPQAGGFYVGRHPTLTTYDFAGLIDDVAIYSDLLVAGDIAAIMGTNIKYWYIDSQGYAVQQDTPPTPFWSTVTGTVPRGLGCCLTPGMGACGAVTGYQPCTACGGGGAGASADLWAY